MPFRPFDESLPRANGPGLDRLVVRKAPEIFRQCARGMVALGRRFLQARQADRFQVARHLGLKPARWHRIVLRHLKHGIESRLAAERRPAREQFVENSPQRINVRRRADVAVLAERLLRSDVARRPHHRPAARLPHCRRRTDLTRARPVRLRVHFLGETEVSDLESRQSGISVALLAFVAPGNFVFRPLPFASRQQNVARLQIAMHDAPLVGVLDGPSEGLDQVSRGAGRPGIAFEMLAERAAFDEFKGEVRPAFDLADLVYLHDVRMLQRRHGLGLAAETLEFPLARMVARQNHLEGDEPVQVFLPCLINNAHAAATEFPKDLVTRHRMAHGAGRRRRERNARFGADANFRDAGDRQQRCVVGWWFRFRMEIDGWLHRVRRRFGRLRRCIAGFVQTVEDKLRAIARRGRIQTGVGRRDVRLLGFFVRYTRIGCHTANLPRLPSVNYGLLSQIRGRISTSPHIRGRKDDSRR